MRRIPLPAFPTRRSSDLPSDTVIGRIWRQHPHFSGEADASLRALIDDCDELLLLSKVIRSTGRARLNARSEEHTSELQSHVNLVCRLLLEKKSIIQT